MLESKSPMAVATPTGPLYLQLQGQLTEWCCHHGEGSRLPSEREIARISGLNRRTVQKAIANLLNDGTLVRDGRITRVGRIASHAPARRKKRPSKARKTIQFVLLGVDDYDETVGARLRLLTEVAEAQRLELKIGKIDDGEHDAQLSHLRVLADQCDGLIVYGMVKQALAEAATAEKLPVVFLGNLWGNPAVPVRAHVVDTDIRAMGELATQTLIAQGHQRIGFLSGSYIKGMWNERLLAGYISALASERVADPYGEVQLLGPDGCLPTIRDLVMKYAAMDSRPTAYVSVNMMAALAFLQDMAEMGCPVPRNCIVVVGDRCLAQAGLDVPLVAMDMDNMIRAATRLVRQIIDGDVGPPHRLQIPYQTYNLPT